MSIGKRLLTHGPLILLTLTLVLLTLLCLQNYLALASLPTRAGHAQELMTALLSHPPLSEVQSRLFEGEEARLKVFATALPRFSAKPLFFASCALILSLVALIRKARPSGPASSPQTAGQPASTLRRFLRQDGILILIIIFLIFVALYTTVNYFRIAPLVTASSESFLPPFGHTARLAIMSLTTDEQRDIFDYFIETHRALGRQIQTTALPLMTLAGIALLQSLVLGITSVRQACRKSSLP